MQQPPVFHANTRLVQLNVIVHDKHGPVANLTKDDFTLTDRGKAQLEDMALANAAWQDPLWARLILAIATPISCTLRILVRDRSDAAVGSLIIPSSQIK